ncbi:MAG: hypothetical protein IJ733_18480 [Lachnospiraceae bacterium]|nr:hypothetical protein [Lachnospiraceae bacterium]
MSDIFEKVSDAFTTTANVISDKAREVSELSALRGRVRGQKKIVEEEYMEIGRQYYEAHKEEEGNYYASSMAKITDALKEIERLEEDIKNIKEK